MSIPHPLRIDVREDALKLSVFKEQFSAPQPVVETFRDAAEQVTINFRSPSTPRSENFQFFSDRALHRSSAAKPSPVEEALRLSFSPRRVNCPSHRILTFFHASKITAKIETPAGSPSSASPATAAQNWRARLRRAPAWSNAPLLFHIVLTHHLRKHC
jgi:hypothetical protein